MVEDSTTHTRTSHVQGNQSTYAPPTCAQENSFTHTTRWPPHTRTLLGNNVVNWVRDVYKIAPLFRWPFVTPPLSLPGYRVLSVLSEFAGRGRAVPPRERPMQHQHGRRTRRRWGLHRRRNRRGFISGKSNLSDDAESKVLNRIFEAGDDFVTRQRSPLVTRQMSLELKDLLCWPIYVSAVDSNWGIVRVRCCHIHNIFYFVSRTNS